MDWNYPVQKYFDLTPEEREEVLNALTKHFFNVHVVTTTEEDFINSTNHVIFHLTAEERKAKASEDFERAEIAYKLILNFIQIQENYEIVKQYGM